MIWAAMLLPAPLGGPRGAPRPNDGGEAERSCSADGGAMAAPSAPDGGGGEVISGGGRSGKRPNKC